MENKISRRKAIKTSLTGSLAAMGGFAFSESEFVHSAKQKSIQKKKLPFRISMNTSTLLGYKLTVDQQIDLVAASGFDGIELWVRDVKAYLEKGGTTAALKEKLEAGGLVLEDMIGFAPWCSDDDEERKKAIDQLRDEMHMTAALGGKFIAAPILSLKTLDATRFDEYAKRYVDILELTTETSVTPLLELWGFGALHKLGDCARIAIGSGHPNAAVLLDFYHMHRGGNSWETLDLLSGKRMPVIHMNDFPATPAYSELNDSDRILPGEGICPFDQILPKLYESGFRGGLSVELFNKGYWETMDAETMLRNSYEKSVTVVERAMADWL